jgi:hypothetical protein
MNHEFASNYSNDYRFFISTNDNEMIQKTLSFIDKTKIIKAKSQLNDEIQQMHVDKIRNNCTVIKPSIVVFYLLQYCDKIVNSESGFGIFIGLNRPEQ